jgi:hypothetical protein
MRLINRFLGIIVTVFLVAVSANALVGQFRVTQRVEFNKKSQISVICLIFHIKCAIVEEIQNYWFNL